MDKKKAGKKLTEPFYKELFALLDKYGASIGAGSGDKVIVSSTELFDVFDSSVCEADLEQRLRAGKDDS